MSSPPQHIVSVPNNDPETPFDPQTEFPHFDIEMKSHFAVGDSNFLYTSCHLCFLCCCYWYCCCCPVLVLGERSTDIPFKYTPTSIIQVSNNQLLRSCIQRINKAHYLACLRYYIYIPLALPFVGLLLVIIWLTSNVKCGFVGGRGEHNPRLAVDPYAILLPPKNYDKESSCCYT